MPSFDVVSKIDRHELDNAIDQTNREITNRFDFKDTNAKVELNDNTITLIAPTTFQVDQVNDILRKKLSSRGVDIKSLKYNPVQEALHEAKQNIEVQQGIDTEIAKKIVKQIKNEKFKVQGSIQGDQIRITGKKRDELQNVIAFLKEQDIELPLQFENFRD